MRHDFLRRKKAQTAAAFSALLLTGFIAAVAAPAAWAQTSNATASTVKYVPEGDRQLIFVNNPERLELGYTDLIPGSRDYGTTFNDLADRTLGNKTILEITVPAGKYRDGFEHVWNSTRAQVPAEAQNPLKYGIRVYNPNLNDITVTVVGRGFINNAFGYVPFQEMFTAQANGTAGSTTYTIPAGTSDFIFLSERDFPSRPIPSGNFFSGVVDFDLVGGAAQVTNFAYQSFDDTYFGRPSALIPAPYDAYLDMSGPQYMGYVTRRYAAATTPAPEARTYKGLMVYPVVNTTGVAQGASAATGGGVTSSLAYTIDDSTTTGDLQVTYPRYANDTSGTLNRFSPSATIATQSFWITGNTPTRDTTVVANDMFDIQTPGFGTLYALFQTFTPNTAQTALNIGNWDIVYHDKITVTNNGARARTFSFKLNNSSGSTPIAYRNASGVWQSTTLNTTPFTSYTFTAPAGQTVTADVYFVMGCPAVTTLRHTLTLTN